MAILLNLVKSTVHSLHDRQIKMADSHRRCRVCSLSCMRALETDYCKHIKYNIVVSTIVRFTSLVRNTYEIYTSRPRVDLDCHYRCAITVDEQK